MGDPSFEDFVRAHLPALGRYAYALTGSPHAGDDLVQDTLVKVAGAWRRVRRDGNALGYARAVMFRTFASRWRVRRRRPAPVPLTADRAAEGDSYAAVEARDALRRALRGLPRPQRAVLVLGYLADLPDEEIAEVLGRRPATVRSLRHRALQALRAQLAAGERTEVPNGQR